MADNGIVVIGGQTVGYTERNICVSWDISSDLITERTACTPESYLTLANGRYVTHVHVQHIYITRWIGVTYTPIPITERTIYMRYSQCMYSERSLYYYPDTHERKIYVEALLTNTPLLLKYPKYFNWNHVPQVLNPEFIIWSFYELNVNDVSIQLMGTSGANVYMNSGTVSSAFTINKISQYQYKITVNVDHVFQTDETVTCYLTAYDVKGNYLKPGMW